MDVIMVLVLVLCFVSMIVFADWCEKQVGVSENPVGVSENLEEDK